MTTKGGNAAGNDRLAEAAHLQAIEGNPLSPDELAMFERFEREGWTPEERRAHIARRFAGRGRIADGGATAPRQNIPEKK